MSVHEKHLVFNDFSDTLHNIVIMQENLVVYKIVNHLQKFGVGQKRFAVVGSRFIIYGIGSRVIFFELMEQILDNVFENLQKFIDCLPFLHFHVFEGTFLGVVYLQHQIIEVQPFQLLLFKLFHLLMDLVKQLKGIVVDMKYFILNKVSCRLLSQCYGRFFVKVLQSGRQGVEVQVVVCEIYHRLPQKFKIVLFAVLSHQCFER